MKKTKSIKLFSIILALMMVVTAIPLFSFADTSTPGTVTTNDSNQTVYTVGDDDYALQYGAFFAEDDTGSDVNSKYFYSDGYFMEDSSVYNPHLATMSMNLAMASYSHVSGTSTDPDYSDQAKHLKTLLGKIGFTVTVSSDYGIKPTYTSTTKTSAYVIAKKELKKADGTSTGKWLLAVIPRSGNYGAEWISNFTLGSTGEAQGISEAAQKVFNGVNTYLADSQNTDVKNAYDNGNLVFWLAGHSRGASVANLTASRIIQQVKGSTNTNIKKNDIFAYCLGSFNVGTDDTTYQAYKSEYNKYIHNYGTASDPIQQCIPYLPAGTEKSSYGFVRYGASHKQSSSTTDAQITAQLSKFTPKPKLYRDFSLKYLNVESDNITSILENSSDTKALYNQIIGGTTINASVSANDFIGAFLYFLIAWNVQTRESYANDSVLYYPEEGYTIPIVNRYVKTRDGYSGKRIEDAVAAYVNIIMDIGLDNLDPVIDVLEGKNGGVGIGDVLKDDLILGVLPLAAAILKWNENDNYTRHEKTKKILEYLKECHTGDGKYLWSEGVLGQEKYNIAEEYFCPMADLVISFLVHDYNKDYGSTISGYGSSPVNLNNIGQKGVILATLVHNIKENEASLFTDYMPATYAGVLMAEDSFYNTANYDTFILNNGTVLYAGAYPTATSAKLKIDGKSDQTIDINRIKSTVLAAKTNLFDIKDFVSAGDNWKLELLDSANNVVGVISFAALNSGGWGVCGMGFEKDNSGKITKINTALPTTVKKVTIGVYDANGKFAGTTMANVASDGTVSIDTSGLTIPSGGSWKLFSTDDGNVPKLAAMTISA